MTIIKLLAEWTLRSSILIVAGAALMRVLKVKDPAVRLAAWTAVLCASLAVPLLAVTLPRMPLPHSTLPALRAHAVSQTILLPSSLPQGRREPVAPPFDWSRAGALLYGTVALVLLSRLCIGLALGNLLLRRSRPAGLREDAGFRESDSVTAPVTLGLLRPVVVLPSDWREWDPSKLDAVLAHERSHIRRGDPALQVLSAFHRALLWHNPLSWFLHSRIVRLAEEASDDAAVAAIHDRVSYAETLLQFIQRGPRRIHWQGVAMARYGRPDERIHRILDETVLSRGVTRRAIATIVLLGLPIAYVAAAAYPQTPADVPPPPPPVVEVVSDSAPPPPAPPVPPPPQQEGSIHRYLIFDGDSMSGSWQSHDPRQELLDRFGRHFAWFRQGSNEYVITDAGVLQELRQANEPQNEVNRLQSDVNDQQSVVNRLQSDVNAQQSVVNAHQSEVNRRQDILNRLQSANGDEDLIRRLETALADLRARKGETGSQDAVNREQATVNEAQARVNGEQAKVNQAQSKVNEQQHRVSTDYSRRIQEIFQSALDRHLAQQLM